MKKNVEAQLLKALELHKTGQLALATEAYKEVLKHQPKNPDALHLLGVVSMTSGDLESAKKLIVKAIQIKGNDSAYFSNLGIVLKDQQNFSAAVSSLDYALKLQPDYPEALCNRALALNALKRHDEALENLNRAISLRQNYAAAYSNRGIVLQSLNRFEEAIDSFRKAIAADPEFVDGFNNYAALLRRLRRYPESLKIYNVALKMNPHHVEAHQGRGELLAEIGEIDRAILDFDRALYLRPNYADALWAKGFTYLAAGRFEEGWSLYEQRFEQSNKQCSVLSTNKPQWRVGVNANHVLVWSEQGVGDEIFFARWLPLCGVFCENVTIAVDPRLIPIYRRSFPNMHFVNKLTETKSVNYDYHLPMGSLPKSLLDLGLDWNLQTATPYLTADAVRVNSFKERLSAPGVRLCGVTWKSTRPGLGEDKSASLRDLSPLINSKHTRLVNLQYGDVTDELSHFRNDTGVEIINVAEVDNFNDLDGHAALVAACDDLVLTCNATAHIAGAMGKTVSLLTPRGKSLIWYWANSAGLNNFWYPTIRMHQQDSGFSWSAQISLIAEELMPHAAR